jgi:4-diphosphocytidyl-2-C-methyl-D-erythritol kinase
MITLKAYAKINLTLNITGRRDDGYHTLDTVMQTVSLHDVVRISKSDDISVECGVLSGKDNIAYKTAAAFFGHTGISGGAKIEIEKHIPVCGGFGGGSADGAAVLRGLNILYNTNLPADTLRALSKSIGADLPFLIEGGTARCAGIGEIITPVKFNIPSLAYCLCAPDVGVSTKEMFKEADKHNLPHGNSGKMLDALEIGNASDIASCLHNDFFPVCKALFPKVGELEKKLYQNGALGVSLTGSGTGLFGVFESLEKAIQAENNIKNHTFAVAATPISRY